MTTRVKQSSKTKPLSEAHIQATCTDWLELDGFYALRTDPVSRREWGKGFGEPGMADHQYSRSEPLGGCDECGPPGGKKCLNCAACASIFWVEWKRKDGKQQQNQKDWKQKMLKLGFVIVTAGEDCPASIEGFCSWYAASGLQRKRISIPR